VNKRDGVTMGFTPAGASDGRFVFDLVTDSRMDKIYLSTSKAQFTFDPGGAPGGQGTSENTQGYGIEGKGPARPSWSASRTVRQLREQLTTETETYFAASKRYDDLKTGAGKKADQAKDLLARPEAALKETKDKVQIDVVS